MDQGVVIDIGRNALTVVLMIIAPMLGFGLITGLLVAIFQATTQIQEQTLAFIPKILAVLISMAIFGPWMLSTMVDFITRLFNSIPQLIG
ncbi:flagellar biosynthesis protein FliQ [Iocasia frigidifontis]|uniref:Flagellar biosynthetic protein FliQ n=1 Tax=Iocasia fonsfrigidae TaxID=2682810 RepID=A0A8A7KGG7_9FIRM|nr:MULTISPECIES: flagellar biosynthesis protein FliQ [Halanaerobiaceae]AZO94054.1 flagellar biosynthetic protein FliQ [Halocella sp. SP3-1]MTI58797.1 flagellar biosynthesis protein FliQ [Bacillota bacterium]QTL96972.1 flagellar biosynthesis protein FliQ [Iocasia fonsfrigidae]